MSSKVLAGSEGCVSRYQWRRVPGAGLERPGDPDPEPQMSAALEERIRQMESESAARERVVKEQAEKAGYQAGRREGEANTAKQAAEEIKRLWAKSAESVQQLLDWRQKLRKQMEEDLVHLSIAVAKRILNRELHVDRDALAGIVHAALAKIDARELYRVRVSTQDASLLQEQMARFSLPARVEIAGDTALPRGSLVLETLRGQLDCSIDVQLQEIDRGLADVVRRSA